MDVYLIFDQEEMFHGKLLGVCSSKKRAQVLINFLENNSSERRFLYSERWVVDSVYDFFIGEKK